MLAKSAIMAVKEAGFEISTVSELKSLKPVSLRFLYNGDNEDAVAIMDDFEGRTLSSFVFHKLDGLSSTFETGLRAPLINRVLSHYYAVIGVLEKIEGLV